MYEIQRDTHKYTFQNDVNGVKFHRVRMHTYIFEVNKYVYFHIFRGFSINFPNAKHIIRSGAAPSKIYSVLCGVKFIVLNDIRAVNIQKHEFWVFDDQNLVQLITVNYMLMMTNK